MADDDAWPRLTEVRLQNFKSVADERIPLRPLTVLIGANSSGKSSVLQALQLLVQAAQAEAEGAAFPLNGNLIRPGAYTDIRRQASPPEEPLTLGVSVVYKPRSRRRRPVLEGDATTQSDRIAALDVDLRAAASEMGNARVAEVSLTLESKELPGEPIVELYLKHHQRTPPAYAEVPHMTPGPSADGFDPRFRGTLVRNGEEVPLYGAVVSGGIPHAVARRGRYSDALFQSLVQVAFFSATEDTVDDEENRTATDPRDLAERLATIVRERPNLDTIRWTEPGEGFTEVRRLALGTSGRGLAIARRHFRRLMEPGEADRPVLLPNPSGELLETASVLQKLLTHSVRYLGPLRVEPQLVMPWSPAIRLDDVGPRGEHTAALLSTRGDRPACVPVPGRKRSPTSPAFEEKPLLAGVRDWMQELDVIESLLLDELPGYGHAIKVVPRGLRHAVPLTHVGVGISQVLPVVTLCLVAPPGSVILLEQPELHLHPAIQQKLADFFIACMESGRQLVVETHSDYVANRLLRHIAEDESDRRLRDVGFVLADRDPNTARTTFHDARPNRFGSFDEWPRGFFDQTPEEAEQTLRAAIRKRNLEVVSAEPSRDER